MARRTGVRVQLVGERTGEPSHAHRHVVEPPRAEARPEVPQAGDDHLDHARGRGRGASCPARERLQPGVVARAPQAMSTSSRRSSPPGRGDPNRDRGAPSWAGKAGIRARAAGGCPTAPAAVGGSTNWLTSVSARCTEGGLEVAPHPTPRRVLLATWYASGGEGGDAGVARGIEHPEAASPRRAVVDSRRASK